MATQDLNATMNNAEYDLSQLINTYIHKQDNDTNPFELAAIDSKYYDTCDIIPDKLRNTQFQYKTLHLNIQGLASAFDQLKILLAQLIDTGVKLDCIMLCETFINDNNAHLYEMAGYKSIYKNRKNKSRGGVALLIRDGMQYKVRDDLSMFIEGEFESLFVEITDKTNSAIIGEIYRVPDTNAQVSLERYVKILNNLKSYPKPVIIGTDQNFDYLKIHTHKITSELLDAHFAANLIPTITKPTRITHTSATLIDNIYVRHHDPYIHSGILFNNMSDHLPVFCFIGKLKTKVKPKEPLTFKYRPMPDTSVTLIMDAIRDIDWSYLNHMETELAVSNFANHLNTIIDTYAPEKDVQIHPRYIIREDWMTKGLMVSSKTCNKLYRKCICKAKMDPVYKTYTIYRNLFNKLKSKAKKNYYGQLFEDFKNDSKRTWTLLRSMIGKANDKSFVPCAFKYNNVSVTDPKQIANHFCKFFADVGPNYANAIPNSNQGFPQYLQKSRYRNPASIFMSPTDPYEIFKIIQSLKPKKSCGHDNISSRFLKLVGYELAKPISILINKSLSEGRVPEMWKIAKIVPIYKSKSKDTFSNYRPISLLPSISKILEKVVHKQTYNFLMKNDIMNKNQYGFRRNHSTINAVTEFVIKTIDSLEKGDSVLSAFLDLSKAFDTIDHNIMLHKLEFYGIRGVALQWFKSYLSNRKQFVKYNNSVSDYENMKCGVPQGSVLGPLLFIIYTNDLPNCLVCSNATQFADDTTVYICGKHIPELYRNMNEELHILTDWFYANKLSLNISKSNYMLFTKSRTVHTNNMVLQVSNVEIPRISCFKLLGLYIDEKLQWNEHISACRAKLTSALYAINKVKDLVPLHALKSIYYTLVHPHLMYGIMLWGSAYNVHLNTLLTLQKKIVRALLNVDYYDHSNPLFLQLNMLKLDDIYHIETLKFMYQYINGSLPISLCNIFKHTSSIHTYNTRQACDIRPYHPKTNISRNSLLCKGPKFWNDIPTETKEKRTTKHFTSTLRADALKRYSAH